MLDSLRKHYGNMFILLGVMHIVVAIVQFWDEWVDLFSAGFFNQIDEQGASYQALGYWFFVLGPTMIAIGLLVQAQIDATGTIPRAFSWIVIATSFAAGFAFYVNGMWLVGLIGMLGLVFAGPARSGRHVPAEHRESSAPRPRFEV